MKSSVLLRFKAIICISILFLTSCRFGNYSEALVPIPGRNNYKSVELFFTTPKQFTTRVYLNSLTGPTSQVTTKNPSLAAIPGSILNTFTNPVYFAILNDTAQTPYFMSINNPRNYNFDTKIDEQGRVGYEYTSSVSQLWKNENCLTQVQILHEGVLDRSHPGSITDGGSPVAVAGDLNLDFTYSRIIAGATDDSECTADLTELADCYSNGAGCSTEQLNAARNLFDLYVNQSGTLNIGDATKLKALEYIVHFE